MSYTTEHQRMRPVLEKARQLDIASHPAPHSMFDVLLSGFNLWCTPDDQPAGWAGVAMVASAFSKPCEYVSTATWGWTDETITHIELATEAYALRERDRGGSLREPQRYRNRPEDVAWCTQKILWLCALAGVECPPIQLDVRG